MFALMTMTRTNSISFALQRRFPHPSDDDNDQVAVADPANHDDKTKAIKCATARQNCNHLLMITARNSSSFHYHRWGGSSNWTLPAYAAVTFMALSPKGHRAML